VEEERGRSEAEVGLAPGFAPTLRLVTCRSRKLLGAFALAGALLLSVGCGSWPDYDPYALLEARRSRKGLSARTVEEVFALPEEEIDLGRAALLIASELRPDFDLSAGTKRLDELVAEAARHIGRGGNGREAVEELNGLLLIRRGIGYYQARSEKDFDITEVLTTRRGNCLNCSMLYLAVADRLGLPLRAVLAPGHVFMRFDDGRHSFNIEPTLGGRQLTDLRYRIISDIPATSLRHGVYLRSLSRREFLAEVLAARGGFLARRGRYEPARRDLKLALSVQPDSVQALVNKGFLEEKTGGAGRAAAGYRLALELDPRNVVALNNLAGLMVSGPGRSGYDPVEARRLVDAAIRVRRRLPDVQRAALMDTAARIAVVGRDWRDAVRYARRAVKLAPGRLDYRRRAEEYALRAAIARKNEGRREPPGREPGDQGAQGGRE